jgi:hypothetical protein
MSAAREAAVAAGVAALAAVVIWRRRQNSATSFTATTPVPTSFGARIEVSTDLALPALPGAHPGARPQEQATIGRTESSHVEVALGSQLGAAPATAVGVRVVPAPMPTSGSSSGRHDCMSDCMSGKVQTGAVACEACTNDDEYSPVPRSGVADWLRWTRDRAKCWRHGERPAPGTGAGVQMVLVLVAAPASTRTSTMDHRFNGQSKSAASAPTPTPATAMTGSVVEA